MNIIKTLFKHFSIKKKLGVTEIITFFSSEIYNLLKKKLTSKEIISPEVLAPTVPLIKKKFLLSSNIFYMALIGMLLAVTIKVVFNKFSSIENKLDNDFPSPAKLPVPNDDNEPSNKILPLHLCYPVCAESSINKYVIFKEKNKDNFSSVQISRGDVGQIIKKLSQWDHALVDFSIKTPIRFQKLDTVSLANQADNEAILIVE